MGADTHDVKNDVKNKKRTQKGFQPKSLEALSFLAERVGFEPTVHCCTLDFESSTFDHSDTSPFEQRIVYHTPKGL